jgi:hypothetical protein
MSRRDFMRMLPEDREAMLDAAAAQKVMPRRPGTEEPYAGLDITGFVPREDLGNAERRAFLSILPRRSLWPDLDRLDQRIADLQRRHTEAQERVRDLSAKRADAPSRDAAALSEWELADRKGPKPEPTTERLDVDLATAERDRDALAIACDRLLEQKATFVDKHRDRLVRVAEQQVNAAHTRARELIDELAQVRDDLASLRSAQLWASLFFGDLANSQPQTSLIAYGLAKPIRDTLQLIPTPQFRADAVLELLRRDVDEIRAAATPEQKARLEGRDERSVPGLTWGNTDQARKERLAELERYREEFVREWGFAPSETQFEAFVAARMTAG